MKTSMQLNALIRNLAREKNVNTEIILRGYMMERLLERISLSAYKTNFILKGGVLIAAMVGLDTRTTMDLDATLRGQNLNEEQIALLFQKVIAVEVYDNVVFTFNSVDPIREEAEYPGFRVSLGARLDNTRQTLKVDITIGDSITPREIEYQYKLMFEGRSIPMLVYNVETVLAEKIESILALGTINTRMRDFYDVYILTTTQGDRIDRDIFYQALHNTVEKRVSASVLPKAADIFRTIADSSVMQNLWRQYQKNYGYANEVPWETAMNAVKILGGKNSPLPEKLTETMKPE